MSHIYLINTVIQFETGTGHFCTSVTLAQGDTFARRVTFAPRHFCTRRHFCTQGYFCTATFLHVKTSARCYICMATFLQSVVFAQCYIFTDIRTNYEIFKQSVNFERSFFLCYRFGTS